MNSIHRYTVASLLGLVVVGCATTRVAPGEYVLSELDGQPYTGKPAVTCELTADSVAGRGPINVWSAPINNGKIAGPVMSTRMAGPRELMDLEARVLRHLDSSEIRPGSKGEMQIVKHGTVLLKFSAK